MSVKLKTIALHVTRVCENRCPFCYLGDENRDKHPSFEKIRKIINELARQEIEEIYFVGGNPCLYPKLTEVLELSHQFGIRNTILSNTLHFRNLQSIVKYVDSFEATILGPNSLEHDKIACRKGSFDNLIRNIKAINENGKSVGIIFNITPMTFDKLFQTIYNLIVNFEIKISYVMIQRIIPRGRASKVLKYTLLSPLQVRKAFEDIEKIDKEFKLPIIFEDPFPLCIVPEKMHKFSSRCEWGFSKGAIDENGNVSRCGSDARFQIGNIFRTNLQELWENSPILKSFRSYKWLPERCQKCSLLFKCGGGCSLSSITNEDHTVDILYPWKEEKQQNFKMYNNEVRRDE